MSLNIIYDDTIYRLQSSGGISTVFSEIQDRLPPDQTTTISSGKFIQIERYLPLKVPAEIEGIFHSTFYRVPDKNFKGPVVTTVHDFTHERFWSGLRRQLNRTIINRAISRSDAIICVSKATKNDLLKYCSDIPESRISVIYNGISDSYKPLSNMVKRKQVLYVGSRAAYKNFDLAVKTVSKMRDYCLVIVGGGNLSSSEKKLLNNLLPGNYEYKGTISNSSLNQEYNKSQFLIYPSSFEGFGIPVLEAMQAGCPVIAVNTSSLPEVCGAAGCLVDHATEQKFLDAANALLDDKFRHKVIEAGIQQAKKFSWDETFFKTMEVYNSLS